MPETNGDGRLLARLDERTDRIDKFISDYMDRTDRRLDENEDCIAVLQREQARVSERMTIAHELQAAWSVILAAIAAWFGSK